MAKTNKVPDLVVRKNEPNPPLAFTDPKQPKQYWFYNQIEINHLMVQAAIVKNGAAITSLQRIVDFMKFGRIELGPVCSLSDIDAANFDKTKLAFIQNCQAIFEVLRFIGGENYTPIAVGKNEEYDFIIRVGTVNFGKGRGVLIDCNRTNVDMEQPGFTFYNRMEGIQS